MSSTFKEITSFIRYLYNEPNGFIPLHAPVFDGNEKKYTNDCINTTYVSSVGKYVDLFEEKIEEYTHAKKAVACVNGTNALYLALKLIGVDQGHEVITQPLSFIATANAITYTGSQPVFIDVDKDTFGISPEALLKFLEDNTEIDSITNKPINKKTKRIISACVPMHTFGHPCHIEEIVDICNKYNIPVVEDAAESLGSYYKEKHTGTFGKVGVLSFNGNKIVTTGGGGMLLFMDEELGKRAKHLSTQAKIPHPWEFIHDEIGFNYRMPNINAAVGLAQLEQIDTFLKSKRETANKYKEFFKTINISFISEPVNALSNYWLNSILFNDKKERDEFLKYSNENGVMTRPAWQLLNTLKMYNTFQCDGLDNSIWIQDRLVNLPSSVILK